MMPHRRINRKFTSLVLVNILVWICLAWNGLTGKTQNVDKRIKMCIEAVSNGRHDVTLNRNEKVSLHTFNVEDIHKNTDSGADNKYDWLTKMEQRMNRRKKNLREGCAASGLPKTNFKNVIWTQKRRLWFMIVNDQYRLMYAYVSKVGSTNWKSAFLVLKRKYAKVEDVPGKKAHDPSLKKLSHYSPKEIEYRLKNYKKFLFVRHPFTRVLSAYRSKLEDKNTSFRKRFGRVIKQRFHPEGRDIHNGANVTLKDFVTYLCDNRTNSFDGHWEIISNIVFPCQIDYDYIGKLESADDDSNYILQKAKVDHLIYFRNRTNRATKSNDVTLFEKYYQTISESERQQLYNVYKKDFVLFGYYPENVSAI
ncbi:carbohydrate sulfotransferase 11-like [Antedon mediterranea]|uniref:carbohydrate sulfotransferase 11-like n=1 Tax=Antedon mediterranea TaxID=105859 RepID=UPI003AF46DA4